LHFVLLTHLTGKMQSKAAKLKSQLKRTAAKNAVVDANRKGLVVKEDTGSEVSESLAAEGQRQDTVVPGQQSNTVSAGRKVRENEKEMLASD
jgi:spore coat protein U-like protein